MSKQDLAVQDPIEMSEEELDKVKEVPRVLDRAYRELLQKGTDYGQIPGTPKPSLWKPGAELLIRWMRAAADTKIVESVSPKEGGPAYFSYTAESRIFNRAGEYLGNGFGSANSKETRYAFRWVYENQIPDGIDKPKLRTRTFKNEHGKEITQYRTDTPSDEIYTLQNTIIKMAKKRAFIDATLSVTGASRIFTQAIEDEEESEHSKEDAKSQTPALGNVTPSVKGFIHYFSRPLPVELVPYVKEGLDRICKDHLPAIYQLRPSDSGGDKITSVLMKDVPVDSVNMIRNRLKELETEIQG